MLHDSCSMKLPTMFGLLQCSVFRKLDAVFRKLDGSRVFEKHTRSVESPGYILRAVYSKYDEFYKPSDRAFTNASISTAKDVSIGANVVPNCF